MMSSFTLKIVGEQQKVKVMDDKVVSGETGHVYLNSQITKSLRSP